MIYNNNNNKNNNMFALYLYISTSLNIWKVIFNFQLQHVNNLSTHLS